MWTITIICIVGTVIFFAFALAIIIEHKEVETYFRVGIIIASVPTLLGILCFLTAVSALDEIKTELEQLKKQKPKWELIQEHVYRKIE